MSGGGFVGVDLGVAAGAVARCVGLDGDVVGLRGRAESALASVGVLGEHGAVIEGFENLREKGETARKTLADTIAGLQAADGGWSAVLLALGLTPSGVSNGPQPTGDPNLDALLKEKFESMSPQAYIRWCEENADYIANARKMSRQELGSELNQAYKDGDKDKIQILTAVVFDDLDGKDEEYTVDYLDDMGTAFDDVYRPGNFGNEPIHPDDPLAPPRIGFNDDQVLTLMIAAGGIPNNDYIFGKSQTLSESFATTSAAIDGDIYKILKLFNCAPSEQQFQGGDALDAAAFMEPIQAMAADALLVHYENYIPDSETKAMDFLTRYTNGEFFGNDGHNILNAPLARAMSLLTLDEPEDFLGDIARNKTAISLEFARILSINLTETEINAFSGALFAGAVDVWGADGFPNPELHGDEEWVFQGLYRFTEQMEGAMADRGIEFGWSNVLASGKIVLSLAEYVPVIGTGAKYINKGVSVGENMGKVVGGDDFATRMAGAESQDYGSDLANTVALGVMEARDDITHTDLPKRPRSNSDVILQTAGVDSAAEMTDEAWRKVLQTDAEPGSPLAIARAELRAIAGTIDE